jgi:uncharacterized protein (DUF1697 family)
MASTHVAFLRGLNVGGNNVLPMKQLAALFTELGCRAVSTYIQSGNVLFQAAPSLAKKLPALAAKRILDEAGCKSPVVVRTLAELERVAAENPFLPKRPPEALHVYFLADLPAPAAVATLDPKRSAPDEFIVRGAEIYLHVPNGMGRTKLSNAWFDSKLATVGTARNWRTITTILALMHSHP